MALSDKPGFLDKAGLAYVWSKISSKFSRKEHIHPYTPEGVVSAPEISVSTTTKTIKEISSVGTLPEYTAPSYTSAELTHKYNVEEQMVTLQYINAVFVPGSFKAGTLPEMKEDTVIATVAASASAPTFTGEANTTGIHY